MAENLTQLHGRLEALRKEYERYFMGLEKRPPHAEKERVIRAIKLFDPGGNSVDRFKHRNLVQRLVTFQQYWTRIERAMEAGTYRREVARADYREQVAKRDPIAQRGQKRSPTGQGRSSGVSSVGQAADDFLKSLDTARSSRSDSMAKIAMRGQTTPSSRNKNES